MAAGDGITKRLFFAIDLDDGCRDAFERLIDQLAQRLERSEKGSAGRVKWIARGNLHLTVRFLGATTLDALERIQAALEEPLIVRPFIMRFDRLGVFPERGAPRVIWVGASSGTSQAEQAHRELEGRLMKAGIAAERRPFRSHLTVGRFRVPGHPSDLPAVDRCTSDPIGPLSVDHLTLYESHLSPRGPSHEALRKVPFMSSDSMAACR